VLDNVPLDRVNMFCAAIGAWLAEHCPEAVSLDDRTATLSEELHDRLSAALKALAQSVVMPTATYQP